MLKNKSALNAVFDKIGEKKVDLGSQKIELDFKECNICIPPKY